MTKWTTQSVKDLITQELQKKGESLEGLEQVIRGTLLEKRAIPTVPDMTANFFSPMMYLSQLGGAASVGAGAVAGAGLYGAYQVNQDSSDKQLKRIKERLDYEQATKQLTQAYAQAQQEAGR